MPCCGARNFCSHSLTKFRPLPLLFARCIRRWRRSQTSPLRYRCIRRHYISPAGQNQGRNLKSVEVQMHFGAFSVQQDRRMPCRPRRWILRQKQARERRRIAYTPSEQQQTFGAKDTPVPARDFLSEEDTGAQAYRVYVKRLQRTSGRKDPPGERISWRSCQNIPAPAPRAYPYRRSRRSGRRGSR